MQFDQRNTQYPPAVVTAAFALKEVGDLSGLVSIPQGYAILKLTDRRPALSRSLEDTKPEIQRRLLDELRNKKKKEFIDEARKAVKIEIFEDELAKLDLAVGKSAIDAGVVGARP